MTREGSSLWLLPFFIVAHLLRTLYHPDCHQDLKSQHPCLIALFRDSEGFRLTEKFLQSAPVLLNRLFIISYVICCTTEPILPQSLADYGPDDAEAYLAVLQRLQDHQIDVNDASARDLSILPGLDPELAAKIVEYRKRSGPYRSLKELNSVSGMTTELLETLETYLILSKKGHHSGRLRLRATRPTGNRTTWSGLRIYQQTRFQMPQRYAFSFLTERDPGESRISDHWSGYLELPRFAGFDRVILGDFRPGFGQGLLYSRKTRSSTGMDSARPGSSGRLASSSSDESGQLRGLLVMKLTGRLTWTAFLSRARWDAAIDTTGVARLQTSGLHLSPGQEQNKGRFDDRSAALNIAWNGGANRISLTASGTSYSHTERIPTIIPSIDWRLSVSRFNMFGEATELPASSTFLLGSSTSFHKFTLTALIRRYDRSHLALRSASFSAYSGNPNNEWGLFLGARWRPSKSSMIEASLDRHGRLGPSAGMPLPGRGYRFDSRIRYRFRNAFTLKITVSARSRRVTPRAHHDLETRSRLRLHLARQTGRIRLTSWLESTRSETPVRSGNGFALGTAMRLGRILRLDIWTNLFRITTYESRIYVFDPAVWGGSRMQMLTGKGLAGGVRLGWGKTIRVVFRQSLLKRDTLSTSFAIQMEYRLGNRLNYP